VKAARLGHRVLRGALSRLEPGAGKLARRVLSGGVGRKARPLPDYAPSLRSPWRAAIDILPQTHDGFLAGLGPYQARPDKGYSLTDCISMETMRREGVSEALTNDEHFKQEGFTCLLDR
jgi:hypothetical protein